LEKEISEAKHSLETINQSRQDAQTELTDFIRSRTELECLVEDLKAAGQNAGGKREELEAELYNTRREINVKEAALNDLLPQWEEQRNLETSEKRRLDEASTRLSTLFAKQGRVSKFRTKTERDHYLRNEITSMSNYQAGQAAALQSTRAEYDSARRSEVELQNQMSQIQEQIEEGRRRGKELSEEISTLKEQQMGNTEKRKDLWREDTKLDSLVKRASDELRTAERALASMMDKVCYMAIRFCIVSHIRIGYWPGFTGR
jgi:structural maintenance of chromosome 3 (chondroitin sulfate proteoglycan 6)